MLIYFLVYLPHAQQGAEGPLQCREKVRIPLHKRIMLTIVSRMLYEFYTHENKKRPGSVHATYLVYGTQSAKTYSAKGDSQQDGEDVSMTSSPFMSSSMPQGEEEEAPPVKVMTVVREENLDGMAVPG